MPRGNALREPERRLPVHPEEHAQPAVPAGVAGAARVGVPGLTDGIPGQLPPNLSESRGAQLPPGEIHRAVHSGIRSCRGRHLQR